MLPFLRMLSVALMILFAPAGCSSPGSDLPTLAPKQAASSYHLGPGDRLEIKVLGADELASQYTVQDDGTIRMLMIGKVPAAGLTPEQLEGNIANQLAAGRYISHPQVSAAVLIYRPFYILGEVGRPGGYPYAS